MGKPSYPEGGFLRRLLRDPAGNTIVIGAAALVPMVAMVGGAVDASRFYMAETRLQAACDAGALAARRAMDTTELTPEALATANAFFKTNFPDGSFGVGEQDTTFTASDSGVVTGNATADMPTVLMGAFGYDGVELGVTCSADVNIANTDVMFVFDLSGSMQCRPEETSCTTTVPGIGWTAPADSKLEALQDAARGFYSSVTSATSESAQIRFGFVNYNSTVNVGRILYADNPNWMASTHRYQSRIPESTFTDWEQVSLDEEVTNPGEETYAGFDTEASGYVSESFCEYAYPFYTSGDIDEFVVNGSLDQSEADIDSQEIDGNTRTTIGSRGTITLRRGEAGYSYSSGSGFCRVGYHLYEREAELEYTLVEERDEIVEWHYKRHAASAAAADSVNEFDVPVDLTGLYLTNRVSLPTGMSGDTVQNVEHEWEGCIEEAETTRALDPVPDDLDINLRPSNNDERWKPMLPSVVYYRYTGDFSHHNRDTAYEASSVSNYVTATQITTEDRAQPRDGGSGSFAACPTEGQRLEVMSEDDFDDYLETLAAFGGTYHDIGMIWGARFIAPNGIFRDENRTAPNGDAISRHLVFMTDGRPDQRFSSYSAWGVEWWDRRTTETSVTTGDDLRAVHANRLQMACDAAKAENISVWVVAFGNNTTLEVANDEDVPAHLESCATAGRAFRATDAETLNNTFAEIAERIAQLRLTQ